MEYNKGKIICFHNPGEENGYLSNWYLSDFTADGIMFSSMEQYMMYQKAILFGDTAIADKILQTNGAGKIKALGRQVSGYNDTIWNGTRQIIIYNGLIEKFRQNTELKDLLLKTGNCILAECAVYDKIWGIGLSMKDEGRFDINKWTGQNLLGFALMETRRKLKS
ncbi:MAG: NADAR family protein [Lachnospiraceae bacterium]